MQRDWSFPEAMKVCRTSLHNGFFNHPASLTPPEKKLPKVGLDLNLEGVPSVDQVF